MSGSRYTPSVEQYLNALYSFLGGEIPPNEDDCITVSLEDENPVTIHIDQQKEQFDIISIVADELPDPVDYSLVLDLLSYAMAPFVDGGPSVGRDPHSGFIQAFVILPFKGMTPDDFVDAFRNFMKFQIVVAHRIADNGEENVQSDPSDQNTIFSDLPV